MQPRVTIQFPPGLRRALAAAEFAAAGLFLLLGADALTTEPSRRIGGDGMGAGFWIGMAGPFLLTGAGLAAGAYAAWRGGRRWWAWQAALPAWGVAGIVVMFFHLGSLTAEGCLKPPCKRYPAEGASATVTPTP